MRPVLAIAKNLLRELFRQRTSLLFLLLVAGSAFALPRLTGGGESLRSKLQLAASYGIGFPVFLIALATLVLAAGSVAREVETQRIQTVVTKPCARWQILLGKLLGILTLDAFLLAVVMAIFVLNTSSAGVGPGSALPEEQLAFQRFYTPRVAVSPELPQIAEDALEPYLEELRADPARVAGLGDAELERRARRALRSARIPPGGALDLRFPGLPLLPWPESPAEGEKLFVSYVLHWSPPGGEPRASCRWEVRQDAAGPRDPTASADENLLAIDSRVTMAIPHEFSLPADVARSGQLVLTIHNPVEDASGKTLIVDPLDVEVLVPYGGFWSGVARSVGLLLAQLALLATLGLIGSSVFSTLTAYLMAFFLYVISLSSSFLLETFETQAVLHARSFTDWVGSWLSIIGQEALALFPDLSSVNPVGRISMGRALTWGELSGEVAWILGVQVTLIFLLAAWLLSRREIAGGER